MATKADGSISLYRAGRTCPRSIRRAGKSGRCAGDGACGGCPPPPTQWNTRWRRWRPARSGTFSPPGRDPAGQDKLVVVPGRVLPHAEQGGQLLVPGMHLQAQILFFGPVVRDFLFHLVERGVGGVQLGAQLADDFLRGAHGGGNAQALEVQAREDPIDVGGHLQRGEIHAQ